MKKGLNEFFTDLGEKEAHGDYTEFNDYDYLGKYQMGEAALVDTGYYMDEHIDYSGKCDWKGTFTGKDGVYSRNDFLNNPQAQENANMEYKKKEWDQLKFYNADKFLGKKVKGILITQSGLLAAAHLKGAKGTANCIKNPNSKLCNPNDAYGTSIYKYLEKFAGYDVSEITGLPSDAFDFPDEEKQKVEQKQPKQKEDKNNQIQEKQEPQKPQVPKTPKILKTKQKRQLSPEELEKAVDKAIVRIYIATIIYGLCYFSAKEGNIQDSTMTLKRVLRIVAKNNNMTMKELVDFLLKKIRELDEYEHKKYMMKFLKPSVSYNQNNSMKFQSQKPLNMNFAELIKPQQSSTVSYEPFYSERNTFVNNTSNINYGNKKFSANNTIKMQSEKNPALYKGTALKQQTIPNNASGYSLLNTAKASLIPQIEYVLPKFNSPKVELDTSPISRSNINPIAQNDFVSNLNNLNIANNSGQDDDIFSLLINAIKKKNS